MRCVAIPVPCPVVLVAVLSTQQGLCEEWCQGRAIWAVHSILPEIPGCALAVWYRAGGAGNGAVPATALIWGISTRGRNVLNLRGT